MEILKFKSTITKMKMSLARLNNRVELVKERINELENKSVEIIQSEEQE